MRVNWSWIPMALMALLICVGVGAGERVFVHKVGSEGGNHFFSEEDAFDLSELLDGETRTFGSGEHEITATREGEVIAITRSAAEGKRMIEMECRVGKDVCRVMDAPDGERVALMIEKHRTCEGEGCGQMEWVSSMDHSMGHGKSGHAVFIREFASCDEGAEGNEGCDPADIDVMVERLIGEAHGEVVMESVGEGGTWISDDGHAVRLHMDGARLRCPEGDTTMSVEKSEVDEVFLCPKHSLPLEQVEIPFGVRVKKIERTTDDD